MLFDAEKTIDAIASKVPKPIADTYRDEEGFLMCANCHTRREAIFRFKEAGKEKRVPCVCRCQEAKIQKEYDKLLRTIGADMSRAYEEHPCSANNTTAQPSPRLTFTARNLLKFMPGVRNFAKLLRLS